STRVASGNWSGAGAAHPGLPGAARTVPLGRRPAERNGDRALASVRHEGPGDGVGVGGWGLAVAAGFFWSGILLVGTVEAPRVGMGVVALAIGLAGLSAGAALGREGGSRRLQAVIVAASFS